MESLEEQQVPRQTVHKFCHSLRVLKYAQLDRGPAEAGFDGAYLRLLDRRGIPRGSFAVASRAEIQPTRRTYSLEDSEDL